MRHKILLTVSTAICMTTMFTACNTNEIPKNLSEESVSLSDDNSEKKTKKLTAINSVPDVPIVSSAKVKSYKHPNKAFSLKDLNTSLFLKNGWEIAEGGTATDNQTDEITSFPAVIQYLDTKNTITVTVADECAEKDSFLAKTEDSYISTYGNSYDSIEIIEFERISIDKFDSIEIVADVKIKSDSFKMVHIITNDVEGKTYSWTLLDNDEAFPDFNLADALSYPIIIEFPEFKDLDSYYKVNTDY